MPHSAPTLPRFADVAAAAARLQGVARRTPVLTSDDLDARYGVQFFFKCEPLQHIGAFKFRGAFNAVALLPAADRARGIVAFSSGNHAQAIARAARLHGVPATIVMPANAPQVKRRATEGQGAQVISYDPASEDREEIARAIAADTGSTLIPPFNHPDVIAGQGTAALEMFEEIAALDVLYCPLGGGGLLAGTLLSAAEKSANTRVFGVEPEAGNDGQQSLARGEIVTISVPKTIADGAATPALGTLTFPIIQSGVSAITTASDDELISAIGELVPALHTVIEPTGALGFAAARRDQRGSGARVGIIVSGGNIDPEVLASVLPAG